MVGKTDTQTPIFSDEMEQVIFHPFWGIPDSIKKDDILPTLLRGSTKMIERYNVRIQSGGRDIDPLSVDWTQNDIRKFHVYQPPGDNNLLGVVKFRFPNKHDVYMHDTPQKHLFNGTVRANSHGCMRVRDPQKLAELILAEDQGWPAGRVASVVASNQPNNQINLKRKVADPHDLLHGLGRGRRQGENIHRPLQSREQDRARARGQGAPHSARQDADRGRRSGLARRDRHRRCQAGLEARRTGSSAILQQN